MELGPERTATKRGERRYLFVAEEILRAVALGNLTVGDRLPDERALAEACKVGRSTVREAILALELAGVVEVRQGAGCYLIGSGMVDGAGLKVRTDALPKQMLEVRQLLEPEAARLCALYITAQELDHLQKLLDDAEKASKELSAESHERFLALNLSFHRDLSRACGNQVLYDTVSQMVNSENHPLWALVDTMVVRSADVRQQQVLEHQAILSAIASGQHDKAREAMEIHLEALKGRIFGSERPRTRVVRTMRHPTKLAPNNQSKT